jgi:hypothetical protein
MQRVTPHLLRHFIVNFTRQQFMDAVTEAVSEAVNEHHRAGRSVYGTDGNGDLCEFPPGGPPRKTRLEEVDIILQIVDWAGSLEQAWAWYRTQPLPSFDDLTAEDLVKQGQAEAVKSYLARIEIGGFD